MMLSMILAGIGNSAAPAVLILLLMDDALDAAGRAHQERTSTVLILLLMDDALDVHQG